MSNFNGLLRRYIDIVNEAAELRTPAEIAASADLLSANDGSTSSGAAPAARNPNAGLTPDDPRWQGPKPAAAPAPNAAAVAGVTPKPQIPAAAPAAAAPTPAAAPAATAPAATPAPAAAKPAGPASPWANDPAKDAAWKALSPEDQKWLGGADPTDKFILARAPKKGAPAAAAPAATPAPATTPAPAPAAAPGAATGVNAQGQNVTMPDGTNPETGAPTVTTAGAPAGQAAKPKVPAKSDPAVQKIQQDLIAKGAKIKADGVMGPATQAAMKQFGQGAKPAAPNTQGYNPATTTPSGMDMSQVSGESVESSGHVMYNEDQALARIIQLARG